MVVLENATKIFSRTYYLTTYLAIYIFTEISGIFSDCKENEFLQNIVASMKLNLFSKFSLSFYFGAFMNSHCTIRRTKLFNSRIL